MAIVGKTESNSSVFPRVTFLNCNSSAVRPPWLLSTIAELEKRIKALANKSPKEDNHGGETFAKRAEAYYQERPQLLSLLQDLYNAYKSLSVRYMQTLAKHYPLHHQLSSSRISTVDQDCGYDQEEDSSASQLDSDAESSLSYQPPALVHTNSSALQESDALIAEIVIKNVDHDILLHEVSLMGRFCGDSSRKIELQKSLLEVLESERLVLLNENANLMYKVAALMAENKNLTAESTFMKRKAGDMARCALKMREDHRVFMLSNKIEDLQGQIHRLEKRNTEYYEQLVKKDQQINENNYTTKSKSWNERGVALEACFQIKKLKLSKNSIIINGSHSDYKQVHKKSNGWWEKVKKMDMFLCGQNPSSI